MKYEELTRESILSEETFRDIFDQEDEILKTRMIIELTDRARELGVKSKFEMLVRAYRQAARDIQKREVSTGGIANNWTNFEGKYDSLYCGSWVASDNGIFAQSNSQIDAVACYHPILPIERMKNMETGEEQIKLAYKRNGRWEEIVVPKTMITSANRIVGLSGRGVSVTSENAKLLVRYLSDVENLNDRNINVQYSTSKLGWIGTEFIPYDTEIIFDGDSRFKQLFDSIEERGSYEKWLEMVKAVRRSGRMEAKFLLAASFASVMVSMLGGLPFFVDLWGETEGGKTVSLMLAASVWANPDESRYIGDFKTTDVALEAKADMLNHLPMFLDDTSKTSNRIRDNFEGVVYDLCSGKGKSRSNKDLGINRENRWKNVIICNGERPLSSYVTQGGAINRVLEVECGSSAFQDPQKVAETIKKNYGFAGKEFVQILKSMTADELKEIQADFQRQLFSEEKMQKQSVSLSIVLTADKIATERIFKDGQYISLEDAKKTLIDRSEVSDNERCYHYIVDKVNMNSQRFDRDSNCEKWGIIEDGYAILYNQAMTEICDSGHFSRKSFLSWASKNKLIQHDGEGNPTKLKKINGKAVRCVFLQIETEEERKPVGNGFYEVDGQEKLPF